jgi:hypothetical protein
VLNFLREEKRAIVVIADALDYLYSSNIFFAVFRSWSSSLRLRKSTGLWYSCAALPRLDLLQLRLLLYGKALSREIQVLLSVLDLLHDMVCASVILQSVADKPTSFAEISEFRRLCLAYSVLQMTWAVGVSI